jgi:hypothetical protein
MARAGNVIPLLVVSGLLVSACGSAGSTTAQQSAPARQSAPAHVTPQTVRVGRLTEKFDTSLPADPAQARVIEDFRTAMVLWDKSEAAFSLVSPVADYFTGNAVHNLASAVAAGKVHDIVPSGQDRMFKTHVTVNSATSATITTCDDGSKFEYVNRATGVVDASLATPPNQQYALVTWQMVMLSGHWAISAITPVMLPDTRAKACQP